MKDWKNNFKEGKELILATSSKQGEPNTNIVISLGFIENKIVVADCQMHTTIKNLKENNRISIISGYYKIKGTVKIFDSGEYLDYAQKHSSDYKVKNAILIEIKEVYDLDKVKRII